MYLNRTYFGLFGAAGYRPILYEPSTPFYVNPAISWRSYMMRSQSTSPIGRSAPKDPYIFEVYATIAISCIWD